MAGTLADRTITVPSIVADYTDDQLNREYHSKAEYEQAIQNYGAIYKTINFSEVTDVNLLKTYCKEWIRQNYYDGVLSFTVKAVDLHLLGYDKDKLKCGDRIPVNFLDGVKTPTTKVLTCLSAQYDLLKPENSTYKIGIPDVAANVKWRESISTKKSSSPKTDKYGKIIDQKLEGSLKDYMQDMGIVITDS